MSKAGAPSKFIIKGKRLDGRKVDETRPVEIEINPLVNANGSATFSFGNSKAIAGVFGPRDLHQRWRQNPQRGIISCKYTMLPFSTTERIRPGHSRRSTEISKVITEAFTHVVTLEEFPKSIVDVFINILQADASTRCAAINAASLAVALAGVPMKNLITSCSVGKIDGKLVVDLFNVEDNYGDVDLAVSCIGDTDRYVTLQMDGIISKDEFFKALEMTNKTCKEIFEKQKEALKKKYIVGEVQ